MSAPDRVSFRASICELSTSLRSDSVLYPEIQRILVSIAVREFPENWPELTSELLSVEPPMFSMFAKFLQKVSTETQITPEHLAAVHDILSG
jgi:hypothetical protein